MIDKSDIKGIWDFLDELYRNARMGVIDTITRDALVTEIQYNLPGSVSIFEFHDIVMELDELDDKWRKSARKWAIAKMQ